MLPLVFVGMQILGGLMRAQAAKRAAQAQAAQDEANAKLAEMGAGDALLRGLTQESAVKQVTSERISTGTAQLAASGVDVQSGSAVDTLAGQRARGELAALVVRTNAAREAWGYQGQARNLRARAQYALQAGDDAFLGELLGTGAQALQAYGTATATGRGSPGVTEPVIRVGEPTYPAPFPDVSFGS